MRKGMDQAAESIRLLHVRRQAVRSLQARIRMVEADAVSLRSSGSSVPVRGGGNRQEQRLVAMISRKEKLEQQERALQDMILQTERALYKLPKDARRVLLWFYSQPRRTVQQMQEELHMGRSTVYRLRDKALLAMAQMLGYL